MKKKLLTVWAAICIAISSWAITQPNSAGAQPEAQLGFTLAYGFYGLGGFSRTGFVWGLASSGTSAFSGGYFGMMFGSIYGPPGMLIGGTVGAM